MLTADTARELASKSKQDIIDRVTDRIKYSAKNGDHYVTLLSDYLCGHSKDVLDHLRSNGFKVKFCWISIFWPERAWKVFW